MHPGLGEVPLLPAHRQRASGWLGNGVVAAGSFFFGAAIFLLPTALRGEDCSLQLHLGASYQAWGWLSSLPGILTAGKAPQLEIRFFSAFSIRWFMVFLLSKYNPTLSQPLFLFLLSLHRSGSLPSVSMTPILSLPVGSHTPIACQVVSVDPWRRVCVTLQPGLLEFQVLWPQHCCV